MSTVVLRRVCVGIAALALAAIFGAFVVLPVALYFISKSVAPNGEGEVGWDLVSMAHNQPGALKLIALVALLIFAAGSYFGFRRFSEKSTRK